VLFSIGNSKKNAHEKIRSVEGTTKKCTQKSVVPAKNAREKMLFLIGNNKKMHMKSVVPYRE